MDLKMFNCPTCGPVEMCVIHGEWVDKNNYVDMTFDITRPAFDVYNARLSENSQVRPDGLTQPRILAEVESFAENVHKFQCTTCGRIFTTPSRVHDSGAVSGNASATLTGTPTVHMPAMAAAMQRAHVGNVNMPSAAMIQMFEQKFTDAELDFILRDVGEDPANFYSRQDKIDHLVERLY
jgi:predicted RNA-binding Zn-ribbon protein involved in translation (DUF1610 family)